MDSSLVKGEDFTLESFSQFLKDSYGDYNFNNNLLEDMLKLVINCKIKYNSETAVKIFSAMVSLCYRVLSSHDFSRFLQHNLSLFEIRLNDIFRHFNTLVGIRDVGDVKNAILLVDFLIKIGRDKEFNNIVWSRGPGFLGWVLAAKQIKFQTIEVCDPNLIEVRGFIPDNDRALMIDTMIKALSCPWISLPSLSTSSSLNTFLKLFSELQTQETKNMMIEYYFSLKHTDKEISLKKTIEAISPLHYAEVEYHFSSLADETLEQMYYDSDTKALPHLIMNSFINEDARIAYLYQKQQMMNKLN